MHGEFDFWERFNLPGESLPGQVLVEITGENRVLIENHRGVREYSREKIGINVQYGVLLVCGSCLELRCMTREMLVICGKIDGITLKRRERK